jgi:hypothetical protein
MKTYIILFLAISINALNATVPVDEEQITTKKTKEKKDQQDRQKQDAQQTEKIKQEVARLMAQGLRCP